MPILNKINSGYSVVIPAAGIGRRFRSECPKQYIKIGDQCLLEHSINCFLKCPHISQIVVALHPQDLQWSQLKFSEPDRIIAITGGEQRAQSVLNGLRYLATMEAPQQWVLVHDACRPFVTVSDVQRLIDAVKDDAVGGILAMPATDTIKCVRNHRIQQTIPRETIWCAQTPQMFRLSTLHSALEQALAAGFCVTDEASAIEFMGLQPQVVMGTRNNIKVTYWEDLNFLKKDQESNT